MDGCHTCQRGSVTAEYVVGLVFFVLVLFAPIDGDGRSAAEMLVDAIKEEHAAYMEATSLPL